MAIGNAWVGTILRVDLSAGTVAKEPLNMQDAHDYVGARSGHEVLLQRGRPPDRPVFPENKLIFMTGALTGTFAPSAGRYEVVSKSPLTGTIGAANSGGHFGPELKYAGYDGIIFEGRATTPSTSTSTMTSWSCETPAICRARTFTRPPICSRPRWASSASRPLHRRARTACSSRVS